MFVSAHNAGPPEASVRVPPSASASETHPDHIRGRLACVKQVAVAAAVQALWSPTGTYLNTASYGLPPRTAWDALQSALEDWRSGRTSWEHWGIPGEEARASFARLVGVPFETVAIGAVSYTHLTLPTILLV